MKTLQQLKELMDQVMTDGSKCYEKGTVSRGRSARKALSEISKLCKVARAELLEQMKEEKGKED